MNSIPPDPPPGKPPCATIPLKKTRWFEDEVHAHDAKLKSYLRGLFPLIDVDSVVQETYVRTWLANAAKPITSAKAFLFTVARRLALNSTRHQKKSPIIAVPDLAALDVVDESRNPVEAIAASEEIALLAEAINSLPPRCREIILLRKLQGVPQRKVAAIFDTTEAAVGQQVCRGLLRLEAFFAERGMIDSEQDKP